MNFPRVVIIWTLQFRHNGLLSVINLM